MTVETASQPSLPPPLSLGRLPGQAWQAVRKLLRAAAELAVAPSAHLASAADRSTARLAAAIILGMLVTSGLSVALAPSDTPGDVIVVGDWILAACAASHLVTYTLSRTRHAALGALGFVATLLAVPVAFLFVGRATDMASAMECGAWMAVSFTIAGALLPTRRLLPLALVATLLFLAALLHLTTDTQIIEQATVLLAMSTICVVVTARHRDRLESIRGSELAARNAELSALRDSLEHRVEERTSALAQANLDLEANHSQLLAAERMALLGRLSAGVAHEMSSPLGAAVCALGDLRELVAEQERSLGDANVTEDDHRELVSEMRGAVDLGLLGTERAVAFLRGMKSHTREQSSVERGLFDATAAVKESLQLMAHAARSARCTVAFEPGGNLPQLMGAPGHLTQIATNLLSNAIDASGDRGGGPIHVVLDREGTDLVLEVRDTAGGIPTEILPRIFEPLFTTKPSGKGTGLGLGIVRDIVQHNLGGRVEVNVSAGIGTSFLVRLPLGRV